MILLLKILGGLSIFLSACALICGLWIKSHPQEDKNFHFRLSLSTVLASTLTIILYMIQL